MLTRLSLADPRILHNDRRRKSVKRFDRQRIEGVDDEEEEMLELEHATVRRRRLTLLNGFVVGCWRSVHRRGRSRRRAALDLCGAQQV